MVLWPRSPESLFQSRQQGPLGIYVTTKPVVINSTLGIQTPMRLLKNSLQQPARWNDLREWLAFIQSFTPVNSYPIMMKRYQVRKNLWQNLSQLRDMRSGNLKKSSSHSFIADDFNTLSAGNIAALMKTHGNQPAFSRIPKKQFRNITRLTLDICVG